MHRAFLFAATPHAYRWCPERGLDDYRANGALPRSLLSHAPGLVLDVGSFDGTDALLYAQSGGHRVYTFEPSPSKVPAIRQRIAAAGLSQNISLYELALANRTGSLTFWVTPGAGVADQIGKPKWKTAKPVEVRVDTLDNVVGPSASVLFAKIDAQSHDPDVLFGGAQLLKSRRIRTFTFELWPSGSNEAGRNYVRLIGWLSELGYRCHDCTRPVWKHPAHRAWSAHEIVANLSASTFEFQGSNIGKWTNVVCFVPSDVPPHHK